MIDPDANKLPSQSDGEEPTSPVEEVAPADEVEVSGDAGASGGSMSVLDALKGSFFSHLSTIDHAHSTHPQEPHH